MQPAMRQWKKKLVQCAFMILFGACALAVLWRLGLLNTRLLSDAFAEGSSWLLLIIGSLLLMAALGILRYARLLRAAGFSVRMRDVAAATLVSQAVGQWAPGSMAVTELIRFGLLAIPGGDAKAAPGGRGGRVGLASLADRTVGLGVMFILGSISAAFVYFLEWGRVPFPALLFTLAAASFLGGLALCVLPLLGRFIHARLLLGGVGTDAADNAPSEKPERGWFFTARARIIGGSRVFVDAANALASSPRALLSTVLLSIAISLINPATVCFSTIAVGRPVPYEVVLAALPLTFLGILLPIGFAGFGGQQLIAAGVFGIFGVDPESIVAASLLQNTMVLAVHTLLGALSAGLSAGRLKALFRKRRS